MPSKISQMIPPDKLHRKMLLEHANPKDTLRRLDFLMQEIEEEYKDFIQNLTGISVEAAKKMGLESQEAYGIIHAAVSVAIVQTLTSLEFFLEEQTCPEKKPQ